MFLSPEQVETLIRGLESEYSKTFRLLLEGLLEDERQNVFRATDFETYQYKKGYYGCLEKVISFTDGPRLQLLLPNNKEG